MRLLLLIAVIAIGADAILHNGAYTQSAWREGLKLFDRAESGLKDVANRP